jgi:murein DD-endopeptidase MepM/ murein hydrolase activator NlpD
LTTLDTTDLEVVGSTGYVVPVRDVAAAGWGPGHSGYPATDIFSACGAELVSPVDGVLLEVRTVDGWDPAVDNPATRGGRSVAIRGNDAVRYYLAHLDEVDPALVPGGKIGMGQRLGTVGLTGRTSACHVHFGISPSCPGPEWSVRRGVVEPAGYLDDWRAGVPTSPAAEVTAWSAANPDACNLAMADPFAADS